MAVFGSEAGLERGARVALLMNADVLSVARYEREGSFAFIADLKIGHFVQ
jgi:hypothetical protein